MLVLHWRTVSRSIGEAVAAKFGLTIVCLNVFMASIDDSACMLKRGSSGCVRSLVSSRA